MPYYIVSYLAHWQYVSDHMLLSFCLGIINFLWVVAVDLCFRFMIKWPTVIEMYTTLDWAMILEYVHLYLLAPATCKLVSSVQFELKSNSFWTFSSLILYLLSSNAYLPLASFVSLCVNGIFGSCTLSSLCSVCLLRFVYSRRGISPLLKFIHVFPLCFFFLFRIEGLKIGCVKCYANSKCCWGELVIVY